LGRGDLAMMLMRVKRSPLGLGGRVKHEPIKAARLSLKTQITYGLLFGFTIAGIILSAGYVFWMRIMPGLRFLNYAPSGTDWLFNLLK